MKLFVYVFLFSTFLFACKIGGGGEASHRTDLSPSEASNKSELEKAVDDLIAFEAVYFPNSNENDGSLALTGAFSEVIEIFVKKAGQTERLGKLNRNWRGSPAIELQASRKTIALKQEITPNLKEQSYHLKKQGPLSEAEKELLRLEGYIAVANKNEAAGAQMIYQLQPADDFLKLENTLLQELRAKSRSEQNGVVSIAETNYSWTRISSSYLGRNFDRFTILRGVPASDDAMVFTIGKTFSEEARDFALQTEKGIASAVTAAAVVSASFAAGRTLYLTSPGFQSVVNNLVHSAQAAKSPFIDASVEAMGKVLGKTDWFLQLARTNARVNAAERNLDTILFTKQYMASPNLTPELRTKLLDSFQKAVADNARFSVQPDREGMQALATIIRQQDLPAAVMTQWVGLVSQVTRAMVKAYAKAS